MKVSRALAAFSLMAAASACTLPAESPTEPTLIRVSPGVVAPQGGGPVPSPSPQASPSPVPSPVVVTPSPSPAPSPSPTPIPTTPSPSPSPSPVAASPEPPLPASTIDHIRVGFFGINCGRGNPVPRNNERILPRGCRGFVTATPKDRDGHDVPAHIHGPDIEWFMLYGEDLVAVEDPTFRSDFNKDLVGLHTGSFGLCATVRNVTGCLIGSVVP